MNQEKIIFKKEEETLLIPLYGKAMESKKRNPILVDKKAEEIIERIYYDFKQLHIPQKTNIMMALRAKQFDIYTKKFLEENTNAIVLHIGCGLDCRYLRVGVASSDWYDLDFPDVIDIKKRFIEETDKFHYIPSSVTNLGWINRLPNTKQPVLILAEGLFMYLHEQEIKSFLQAFSEKYPYGRLVFDCFSKLTARQAAKHPSLRKTGASLHWGIDDELELEHWDRGIKFIEEWGFSDSEDISKLSWGFRFMFKFIGYFKMARIAHRILVFDLFRK